MSGDKMAGWHHRCNGHELGKTLGDGEGKGGMACCSPWGCKKSDMTGYLIGNNNESLEKGMTTHSNSLAWRIPWTEEPGGLQSMRSQRVGQTGRLTHMNYRNVCRH